MNPLEDMLLRHEGLELRLYEDTVGKKTIGVGRNLSDNGITREEAFYLLQTDINRTRRELNLTFDWYNNLDTPRKHALIDMCFNLGLPRFKQFKKMIAALEKEDYITASKEMLDSRWATQVGRRAIELSEIIRTGEYD